MTKFLVSGYIGFDNFGDEAIASVLTSHLKSLNAEEIVLLSSNPEKTAKLYNVKSVGMFKFLSAVKKTDVLISGGGSLLQDITSLKSLLYYLAVITSALIFKKKVIIFAQGFTPFRTKLGKFLTKQVLKKCYKITVRDSKSQNLLSEMGILSDLVADPVFGIEVNEHLHQGIGVQLRDFHSVNDNFLYRLAEQIEKYFKSEEIKLISLQDSIDLPLLEKFEKILNKKEIKTKIYKNLSINDAIKTLSELEYLVGMRFHANLVASKAKVKVLGINYDIKVLNLANTVDFPIIGLEENYLGDEFEQLLNLDTQNYKIPNFDFPNIT